MPNKNLKLTDIIADDRYQGRVSLDETVVAEYAALLKADTDPWPFEDPCDVVEIDGKFWLGHGFHRYRACQAVGRETMNCDVVVVGTHDDLMSIVLAANATNGLRRSAADRRRVVEMALADDRIGKLSSAQIAEQCCVSAGLVQKIRREQRLAEQESIAETDQPAGPQKAPDGGEEPVVPERVHTQDGRTVPASKEARISQQQKIAALLDEHPDWSDRQVAGEVGCDHKTVGSVRRRREAEEPLAAEQPAEDASGAAEAVDDDATADDDPDPPVAEEDPPAEVEADDEQPPPESQFDLQVALDHLRSTLRRELMMWPASMAADFFGAADWVLEQLETSLESEAGES